MKKIICLLLLIPVLGYAGDLSQVEFKNWKLVKSDNYHLYTDARGGTVGKMVVELDRFIIHVETFLGKKVSEYSQPIKIYAFSDSGQYKIFQENEGVPGFFTNDTEGNVIVLKLEDLYSKKQWTRDVKGTLFHEMTHYLISKSGITYSMAWYEEAVAEYLSTTHFKGDRVEIGKPLKHRIRSYNWMMSNHQNFPLEEALKLVSNLHSDGGYKRYNALALYATYSFSYPEYRKKLNKFIALNSQGETVEDAWNKVYGISFKKMAKILEKMVSSERYPITSYKQKFKKNKYRETELSSQEALMELTWLGERILNQRNVGYKYLESWVSRLEKDFSNELLFHQILLRSYEYLEDWKKYKTVLDDIEQCCKSEENKSLIFTYKAKQLLGLLESEADESMQIELLKKARTYVRSAIKLDNMNMLAFSVLGDVYYEWHYLDATISVEEGIVGYSEFLFFADLSWAKYRLASLMEASGDKEVALHYYKVVSTDDRAGNLRMDAVKSYRSLASELGVIEKESLLEGIYSSCSSDDDYDHDSCYRYLAEATKKNKYKEQVSGSIGSLILNNLIDKEYLDDYLEVYSQAADAYVHALKIKKSSAGVFSKKKDKISEEVTHIPLELGTVFGVEVFLDYSKEIERSKRKGRIPCLVEVEHPPMKKPGSLKPITKTVYRSWAKPDGKAGLRYTLEKKWEMVPGEWKIKILSIQGDLLYEKEFELATIQ